MQGVPRGALGSLEEPVVKVLKLPETLGKGIQGSIKARMEQRQPKLSKEQERNMAQEGAFRRLLQEHQLAVQYDLRLNASTRLWMQSHCTLSAGDPRIGGRDEALVLEAISSLERLKQLEAAFESQKQADKASLLASLSRSHSVAYSRENYETLLEECQAMHEALAAAQQRAGELAKANFELDIETKRLTLENEGLKKDNLRLSTELGHHQGVSKAALKQLEVVRRANLELTGMRNQEALKSQMDSEHCRLGLLSLQEARGQLAQANEELAEQCRGLRARLEEGETRALEEGKSRRLKEMEER